MQIIQAAQDEIMVNSNINTYLAQAENIDDILSKSKVPQMPNIATFVKSEIKGICDSLSSIAQDMGNIKTEGKTEDEIKKSIQEYKDKAKTLGIKAKVITSRGNKAIVLNEKFTAMMQNKIDETTMTRINNVMDKVYQGITKDTNVEETKDDEKSENNQNQNNSTENIDENDKVTKDMNELIEALDNKDKPNDNAKSSNELIAAFFDDNNNKQKNTTLFNSNNFVLSNNKKKNPFEP